MVDRAVVFIDGNNWYHCLIEAGIGDKFRLDYGKISQKLVGVRIWAATRYYIGRVNQEQGARVYADQRKFIDTLEKTDSRITVHLGRLEPRIAESDAAKELLHYVHGLTMKIDSRVFKDLVTLAKKHEKTLVWVEKAVDVQLAVDMVVMANRNDYDAAYLLSADGDFTGAVEHVRGLGKKVYAACPGHGAQLAKAVNSFIHLPRAWFQDCYR
jgi:uncharacterized LabA/DUF88 family protein